MSEEQFSVECECTAAANVDDEQSTFRIYSDGYSHLWVECARCEKKLLFIVKPEKEAA